MSGTLLQGVARNPLADPGIMGINAGAAVGVVIGILGARLAATGASSGSRSSGRVRRPSLVYTIASFGREGATPVKLALAGAVVTAGLTSITTAIVLADIDALKELRFWQVGALAGRYMARLLAGGPFIVSAWWPRWSGARAEGLALGEDLAVALGQRVRATRIIMFVDGGGAVRCGDRGVRAHRVRRAHGAAPRPADLRARLPVDPAYSLVLDAVVLLLGRHRGALVSAPGELQVGVVLGVVGAPVFIVLVRYCDLAGCELCMS